MKKLLAVGVIVLFLSVSVIPSTGTTDVKQITIPATSGNTLYVGGNGTGNYTKIQDAIDNSSDGDTVYVYDDSSPYYENVVVDKSINLIGEDRDTTVIDGNNLSILYAVKITTDWVNISGFTIRNSGGYMHEGILIFSKFSNIKDNIISNNYYGITLVISSSNTISDNIITSNHDGIYFVWSHENTATGNNISNNLGSGIYFFGESNSNTISGNFISNNEYGILLEYDSIKNTISDNIISNNEYGIYLFDSCNGNYILRNNIINNVRHASFIDCWKNTWRRNYWKSLPILPVPIIGGIWLGNYPYSGIPILWVNFDWRPALIPYSIEV